MTPNAISNIAVTSASARSATYLLISTDAEYDSQARREKRGKLGRLSPGIAKGRTFSKSLGNPKFKNRSQND